LVFITEMKSVYSTVRTGSVNKAVRALSLKGYYNLGMSVGKVCEMLLHTL
jgi:hypothetical protein